jgi:hypothetical protein
MVEISIFRKAISHTRKMFPRHMSTLVMCQVLLPRCCGFDPRHKFKHTRKMFYFVLKFGEQPKWVMLMQPVVWLEKVLLLMWIRFVVQNLAWFMVYRVYLVLRCVFLWLRRNICFLICDKEKHCEVPCHVKRYSLEKY